MRTPEVEAAMKRSVTDTELVETKTPPWNRETLASVDRRTLAAEIERLEAELAKSDEAARAAMYAVDERAFLAECAETSVKRAEAAEARVRELEAQNARLREALEDIAAYDVGSRHAGTCPYGCDTPAIAQNTLAAEAGRARAATKALADGKAAP